MSGADLRALYPDFEVSLLRYGLSQTPFNEFYSPCHSKKPYYKLLKKVESIYNKDKIKSYTSKEKIPHLIHQIWLGGKVPAKYSLFIDSWKKLTGWEYRLWGDQDLSQFSHPLLKQAASLVEKADVLRLEILRRFGGLYVDTDVMCLDGSFFSYANHQYSFYAGLEPLDNCYIRPIDDFYLRVGTAVLASIPEYPLVTQCLEEIEENFKSHSSNWPVARTGPDFVTKVIYNHQKLLKDAIVFPPTFFYPLSCSIEEAALAKLHIRDESACIHYFDISWGLKRS